MNNDILMASHAIAFAQWLSYNCCLEAIGIWTYETEDGSEIKTTSELYRIFLEEHKINEK
jgi:hypothetical protein